MNEKVQKVLDTVNDRTLAALRRQLADNGEDIAASVSEYVRQRLIKEDLRIIHAITGIKINTDYRAVRVEFDSGAHDSLAARLRTRIADVVEAYVKRPALDELIRAAFDEARVQKAIKAAAAAWARDHLDGLIADELNTLFKEKACAEVRAYFEKRYGKPAENADD